MCLATVESNVKSLDNIALADSLIINELSNFNISEKEVEVAIIKVDSNFIRKVYYVGVPPAFSKTRLHAELNRTFYNHSVKTPATVTFPEKDVRIHFLYNNTVIRTLKLKTDTDLVFNQGAIFKGSNVNYRFPEKSDGT